MAFVCNDVDIAMDAKHLFREKHITYIAEQGNDQNDFDYCMTEFIRMSGIYWGMTAIDLLDQLDKIDRKYVIEFIKKCQCVQTGGISACEGHDPHILYTLSAIQESITQNNIMSNILCIYDCCDEINIDAVADYVLSLQQPDGSFFGDKWGEVDTRFSFCAVAILSLLKKLETINLKKATEFILSCCNADGGFGSKPNAESHAGLIYCCVGFLSVTNQMHLLDCEKLAWWLCERQLPSGGLNGRPEKLPDVCYSWWVLAALTIMGRLHWIDSEKVKNFILSCQDSEFGGFSDRTGNCADVFHTLFGLGALSLLGNTTLKTINPTYCMPQYVIDRLKLKPQMLEA